MRVASSVLAAIILHWALFRLQYALDQADDERERAGTTYSGRTTPLGVLLTAPLVAWIGVHSYALFVHSPFVDACTSIAGTLDGGDTLTLHVDVVEQQYDTLQRIVDPHERVLLRTGALLGLAAAVGELLLTCALLCVRCVMPARAFAALRVGSLWVELPLSGVRALGELPLYIGVGSRAATAILPLYLQPDWLRADVAFNTTIALLGFALPTIESALEYTFEAPIALLTATFESNVCAALAAFHSL